MNDFIWGFATDKGQFRKKNQDRVFCQEVNVKQGKIILACVCDGVGSFEFSEQASDIVIRGLRLWMDGLLEDRLMYLSEAELYEDLMLSVTELNELINEKQQKDHIRLGCTMSLLLIINRKYYIIHVGDSRIYNGFLELKQLTADEISISRQDGRKKLTNCMGLYPNLNMAQLSGKVKKDSIFVLGSDGLFNYQDISKYSAEIMKVDSSQKMSALCYEFVQRARSAGEKDNISCIIIRIKRRYLHF